MVFFSARPFFGIPFLFSTLLWRCVWGVLGCSLLFSAQQVQGQPRRTPQNAQLLSTQRALHVLVDTDIDERSARHLSGALEAAKADSVSLVILELSTYGGELSAADKMRQALLAFELPVYVFINKNAASAGALISLACDSIYMAPGASIGAATVVTSPLGAKAPDKYQSYMRGIMRSTAEAKGRDPKLAEAMVDADLVVDSLAPKGKVLTLSTNQALARGICDARLVDLSALFVRLGLETKNVIYYKLSFVEHVIAFFMHPFVSSVLIMILLGGIYTEIRTPGLGVPGIAAVVAALLYLIPYYLNGLAAYWEIALLFIGLALIAVEVFAIPGLGIVGLVGVFATMGSLFLLMVNNDVFDFSLVAVPTMTKAGGILLFTLLGMIAFAFVVGSRIRWIATKSAFALRKEMPRESGYHAGLHTTTSLIGQHGVAYSVLRPSGRVVINDEIYEAVAVGGDFIQEGTEIEVLSEEGRELGVVIKDASP